jgi:cobalt-precorrin 5A hydrolase
MKLACFSFTDKGFILGERLSNIYNTKYKIEHFSNSKVEGGIKNILNKSWSFYDGFIFISATGIAVRMINPFIESKSKDPAIVVVDDMGKFSISLLSGHLGGANVVAQWIGESIGAIPIITTASDNRGIDSIDMFAKRNNYYIEDMNSVTRLTSMMVNDRRIGFYSEEDCDFNYNNVEFVHDLEYIDETLDGIIIVSSKENLAQIPIPYTVLRPRNLNVGIGCRLGIDAEHIIEAIKASFREKNLSTNSISKFGTVEVKKHEIGIIKAAEHFNCPLKIFNLEEIEEIQDMFQKSQFVKDTIGVYSVSEPCAYFLGGELITRKSRYNGVTISISRFLSSRA